MSDDRKIQQTFTKALGASLTYISGDPPTDRGPIVGVPQDDLNALHTRIAALEAEVARLREALEG